MAVITTTSKTLAPGRSYKNGNANKLQAVDEPVHDWYRFVLSFPPHLVEDYIKRFDLQPGQTLLDPFCGTGTTLVTAKMRGIASVGIEANVMAHFASTVKVDWSVTPDALSEHARLVAECAAQKLAAQGIEDDPLFYLNSRVRSHLLRLDPEKEKLLLRDSISPLPLHKTLVLLEALQQHQHKTYHRHELLALAKALVFAISNLRFGPEVGIGKPKEDAPVLSAWLNEVDRMARDLAILQGGNDAKVIVHLADAREIFSLLKPNSIDAVITSPPYPNEKDYTRTTRLESVLLGFINNHAELRALKRRLVRSNTRTVYKGDSDDQWIAGHPEIQRLAHAIEQRRIELGKTSGFERLYGRVTKLYFGGMARHLAELRRALKPGAQLAYVVGDQASYLRVMIRTGQLLADIAQSLGYEVAGIDLFRTRLATATREQLREEVVVLKWPGKKTDLAS
ncbi:DNA methyltransferase [candidate division KSB1 bacterium]|nr:DNA methyltransferase [candidate division KSB1 bacterium]